jgi:hypothetical protein
MPGMNQQCAVPEHRGAAAVRAREQAAVLANQLQRDSRWGQPCLAYNVFVRMDQAGQSGLAAIQDEVLRREPSLLRVPPEALHITAVFLLGLYEEFDRPKDELWLERGAGWIEQLTRLATATAPFRLVYRHVVATAGGIIAIADEPNGLSEFRARVRSAVAVPGKLGHSRELVHTTLFRYARPLRDPAGLLSWLAGTRFLARLDVSELVVARENTYPFTGYDVLRRLRLGRHGASSLPSASCGT